MAKHGPQHHQLHYEISRGDRQMAKNGPQHHQLHYENSRGGRLDAKWPKMVHNTMNSMMKLVVEAA